MSLDGGMRFIVGDVVSILSNRQHGERAVIVPNHYVNEPVDIGDAYEMVVKPATREVFKRLLPENPCGDCRECCVTPYIEDPALKKPSHTMCSNCDQEIGCTIQMKKPKACAAFECEWLKSKSRNDHWPEQMRPDRCGVIFSKDNDQSDIVDAHQSAWAPEAFTTSPVMPHIIGLQAFGLRVRRVTHYHGEKR